MIGNFFSNRWKTFPPLDAPSIPFGPQRTQRAQSSQPPLCSLCSLWPKPRPPLGDAASSRVPVQGVSKEQRKGRKGGDAKNAKGSGRWGILFKRDFPLAIRALVCPRGETGDVDGHLAIGAWHSYLTLKRFFGCWSWCVGNGRRWLFSFRFLFRGRCTTRCRKADLNFGSSRCEG